MHFFMNRCPGVNICFPQGCMIHETIQSMLTVQFVPQLKAAGMTRADWTRGASLEEPYLSRLKGIVCKGCGIGECQFNANFRLPDLDHI